jgi:NADPH-dependent 2,4-dienoyl-CoA reductase/sulfur reductase-like enzyme
MARLVVIGGVAAGMSAAAEAKRADPSLEVRVYERGPFISYGACGLPYFIANPGQPPEALMALTPEKAEKEKGLRVFVRHEVLSIDPGTTSVTVRDLGSGAEERVRYDKLVIATGAIPVKPRIPGIDLGKVFFLRTLRDGISFKGYLESEKPGKACLVAEGHIGLEVAESLLSLGIEVTILAKQGHLCWWLDAEMAQMIEERAVRAGVRILKNTSTDGINEGPRDLRITTSSGDVDADFVFVSLGMKPETSLAKACGVRLGRQEAIDVNEKMETSVPGIYAAGDCANIRHLVRDERFYMPRGTHANRQGRIAGANAAGRDLELKGVNAIVVFKFLDLEIGRVGLSENEARLRKIDVAASTIKSVTRAGYYGGGKSIHVKLVADRATGRLLGGQIVGGEHVARRIDVLSAALYNRMTVSDMKNLDMGYAPPVGIVWDPLLTAVNVLDKKM